MPRIRRHTGRCSPGCAVEATLGLIAGKWKGVILDHLLEGPLRFSEIRRRLTSVMQHMFTNHVCEMAADGLMTRKIYGQISRKVDYILIARWRFPEPVIRALKI